MALTRIAERGTNENSGGLLRQYLPKGMDFDHLTDRQLASYVRQMNQRPRGVPQLPDSGRDLLAPTCCTYDVNSPGQKLQSLRLQPNIE